MSMKPTNKPIVRGRFYTGSWCWNMQ